MKTEYKIRILKDKTKLKDIYNFRVQCYEDSDNNKVINKELFTNGWQDYCDSSAYHFIVTSESKIIASARFLIIKSNQDLINIGLNIKPDIYNIKFPIGNISRLSINLEHRKKGLSNLLDSARLEFATKNGYSTIVAEARKSRANSLIKLGFKSVDFIDFQAHPLGKKEKAILLIKNKDQ